MEQQLKTYRTIIAILLILVGVLGWKYYQKQQEEKNLVAYANDYPLVDPGLPFYEKENLVVNIQSLRDYYQDLIEKNQDWADISIYFEVLNTGATADLNTNLKIIPASLVKLPIGMVTMKRIQDGKWSYDTVIKFNEEDARVLGGDDADSLIGQEFTVQTLLEMMMLESDNMAWVLLVQNLTGEEILKLAELVGLDREFANEERISPKEYSRLLRLLYLAVYLDAQHSQNLLELMTYSQFEGFLRPGIPSNVPFARRWSAHIDDDTFADSGIVYLEERPYMISVMIKGKTGDNQADYQRTNGLMKEISQRTYNLMTADHGELNSVD